ncbi:MAG TPA: hypothetical protein VF912_02910 [Anaeromyxobacter sp.]
MGAARTGGAWLELVRMLATFVWVAGATVVMVAALGWLPGWITGDRGTVRRLPTVQDAERRLGARVLVPGYFPDRLDWPPRSILVAGGRRGSVRLDLSARHGPEVHILEATREGEPIAPELLAGRTVLRTSHATVLAHPASLSDVLVEGTLHRELAWEVQGRAMILRSSGDVEELFRMARTSHREGGR